MSVKNNKSVATQALLEMDTIVSAIKDESKKTLGNMLNEAVKKALRERAEGDDEKEYEVIDDEQKGAEEKEKDSKKKPAKKDVSEVNDDEMNAGVPAGNAKATQGAQPQQQEMGGNGMNPGADNSGEAGAEEAPDLGTEDGGEETPDLGTEEGGEGDNGWDDFSQYQVGDNEYDLTNASVDDAVTAYLKLGPQDKVVIRKEGNTIDLEDNDTGKEYLIKLDGGEEDSEGEEMDDMNNDEAEEAPLNEDENGIAGLPDGTDEVMLTDSDPDSESLEPLDNFGANENNFTFESRKMRKPMKESKEVLFEVDLGYTDNYQDKDPIKGLSNNEPSKSGKSWHKGVPTGTEKPWAGPTKDKGKPFGKEKTIEEGEDCCPKCGKCGDECTCEKEIEEANLSQARWNDTHAAHNRVPAANDDAHRRMGMQKTSKGTEYRATSSTNESKELKTIKAENRELKKAVVELRKNLNEAYITNVNLGKITKLFLENTTSQAEKIDIVNRFANEAKTVEQSKTLFESISRELKKSKSGQLPINESSKTAKGTKELNENAGYKSNDVLKTIDLMNRVMNC